MTLSETFTKYLRSGTQLESDQLADALDRTGYAAESSLLRRFLDAGPHWHKIDLPGNAWNGHRCWTGRRPPAPDEAGEIWMDTVEMIPMLLVPDEKPDPKERYSPETLAGFRAYRAWMAVRPVANWQFQAFLDCAKLVRRSVQIGPPFPLFDAKRILRGRETDPVTGLLCDEALLYANWFRKVICGEYEWRAAARLLTPEELEQLWGPIRREWAGRFNEGVNAVVCPDTVELNLVDEYDSEESGPESSRIFYGEWEAPRDVTFRTAVSLETGLLGYPSGDPLSPLDVELAEFVER